MQLIVNDGTVASAPDTVTTSTVNSPPVANAGADQSGTIGTTITLDGSHSSDVDGDTLTYQWAILTKPTNSTATLSDPTAVNPTFILDKSGTYTAQLIVSDSTVSSDPDTVTISTLNTKPIADVGEDKHGVVGATITLDGTLSSDPDGDPLTYQWSLTTKPTDSTTALQNPTTATPSFVLDKPGTYVVQLIVNDGTVDSDPDTATITVPDTTPPPADTGKITVGPISNGQVTITGSAGSVEGNAHVTLTNPRTNEAVTVTANADGSFSAQLGAQVGDQLSIVVTDSAGNNSSPGSVSVSSEQNRPPVANAGTNQAVQIGYTVTLDGSHSADPDGDPLTYQWSFTSIPAGSTATLDDSTVVMPTFVPDIEGTYVVQLIVSDGQLQSPPATITITATVGPPPAQVSQITTSVFSRSHVVIIGTSGSVTGSTTVTVTNTRTGQAVTVKATGSGSFGAALAAQAGDLLSIVVTDAAGNASSAVTTVVNPITPASVTITAPAAGVAIPGDRVLVRGTIQGPPNTGVTVNGIAASVQGTSFLANNVPLTSGSNTLTVTATTLQGQTATTSVTVTSTGTPATLTLDATPGSGITGDSYPLPVTFTYAFNSSTPIQDLSMDFDGDGTFEFTDAPPDTILSGGYSTPGVQSARLTVRDQQGHTFQAEAGIVVQDVVAMDALLKGTWDSMNTALLAGDKATALSFLTPLAREKYERVFDALLPDMAAIVATFTSFRGVSVAEGFAEYALNRTINGENRLFLIYFFKDADGVWRLEAM